MGLKLCAFPISESPRYNPAPSVWVFEPRGCKFHWKQEFWLDMPTSRFVLLTVFVLAAAFSRLVPHPLNVAPITAMALFGAAHFRNRFSSVALPLVAMLLSDVVLYSTKDVAYRSEALINMLFVYSALAIIAGLGQWLRGRVSVARVIGTTLAGSVVFFLVTNFGAWLTLSRATPPMYSQSFSGLIDCFVAGLPFFKNTVLGDLGYAAALFGGFAWLAKWLPEQHLAAAHSAE